MDPVIDSPVDCDSPRVEHHDDLAVDQPRPRRPRRCVLGALAVLGLVGGGLWWHRAVTADPGLVFDGGASVDVAYEPGGKTQGFFGLYKQGGRAVRIEAVPPAGFYYWRFDGAAVSEKWQTASAGGDYAPFRPFNLRPGETRYVRLDFRQATCDPAGLQPGSSRIDSLPVRYRVLGRTRTVDVPFDDVTIAVRTIGLCDRPL